MNKVQLPVFTSLLIGVTAGAQQFQDDFNRKSTPFVETGKTQQIGKNWECSDAGVWRISNNQVMSKTVEGLPKPVLYNKGIVTDGGFKLSGIVTLNSDHVSAFAGLVTHYQNPTDQYIFRFNGRGSVQLLRKNGPDTVFSKPEAFKQNLKTPYKMTLISKKPHVFELSIEDTTTGTVVFSQTVTDPKKTYSSGFGGFFTTAGAVQFDDISYEKLK